MNSGESAGAGGHGRSNEWGLYFARRGAALAGGEDAGLDRDRGERAATAEWRRFAYWPAGPVGAGDGGQRAARRPGPNRGGAGLPEDDRRVGNEQVGDRSQDGQKSEPGGWSLEAAGAAGVSTRAGGREAAGGRPGGGGGAAGGSGPGGGDLEHEN